MPAIAAGAHQFKSFFGAPVETKKIGIGFVFWARPSPLAHGPFYLFFNFPPSSFTEGKEQERERKKHVEIQQSLHLCGDKYLVKESILGILWPPIRSGSPFLCRFNFYLITFIPHLVNIPLLEPIWAWVFMYSIIGKQRSSRVHMKDASIKEMKCKESRWLKGNSTWICGYFDASLLCFSYIT